VKTAKVTDTAHEEFIPALRFHWLTALYDLVVRITCREKRFKTKMIELAGLEQGEIVLDVGCGSGTLSSMAKQREPSIKLTGVDADANILARARKKAAKARQSIEFIKAYSQDIPLSDSQFDVALSSLFFHHLQRKGKQDTLLEINRLLGKSGRIVIADWGKPTNLLMSLAFLVLRLFDGLSNTRDNARGDMPKLIAGAGFTEVQERATYMTFFGSMKIWTAISAMHAPKAG